MPTTGIDFYTPSGDMVREGARAMMRGGRQMVTPYAFRGPAYDAVSNGMAFITGELEKVDPKVREPLSAVTWQRDIVARTGGGWVEYTSTFDLDYGTTGPNDMSIVGTSATTVPVMQVSTNKNLYKVFTWMHAMKIEFVNQAKLKQIGRSLEDLLNKGIRLNYNKTLDQNVYKGFVKLGTTGLLNDPKITAEAAAKGAKGTTAWKDKTPDEILDDINQAVTAAWVASEYDLAGMPNHILIPPSQYTLIANRKVSEAGNVSVLDYLMQNNIAEKQGQHIVIEPCRWCIGAGTGGTDRMMVYVNDEDKVNFDITVPATRAMTSVDALLASYITLYAAQIGQVKFMYYQPARYVDGI